MYFKYGEQEMNYLSSVDKKLGQVILDFGKIERTMTKDMFAGLVNAIISQQITTKAMETVWTRLNEMVGKLTPKRVLEIGEEKLCTCGISGRKAEYITKAACEFVYGGLDSKVLMSMNDDDFVFEMCKLKGVGKWTCQMLLIFTLGRQDVFPLDDFGVIKGMKILHGEITQEELDDYVRLYSPYGSVAAIYMWALASK